MCVDGNQLKEFPNVQSFFSLRELRLHQNQISSFSQSTADCLPLTLESLNLSANPLSTLPNLLHLTNLQELYFPYLLSSSLVTVRYVNLNLFQKKSPSTHNYAS